MRIPKIAVLCGGLSEESLRKAGFVEVYPGPAALLARFEDPYSRGRRRIMGT
jgi:hypothetical protein